KSLCAPAPRGETALARFRLPLAHRMKLHVSHLPRYDYAQSVHFSPHLLYLRPRETPLLRVNSFGFNIAPEAKLVWTRDSHDVLLAWAYFWAPAAAFNIRSEFEVETFDTNPF